MQQIKRHDVALLAGLLIGLIGGFLLARPAAPARRSTPQEIEADAEKMIEDTDKWLAQMERDLEEEENK